MMHFKKRVMVIMALMLTTMFVYGAGEARIMHSKFKKQNTMIIPVSKTEFKVIDKNGKSRIVDLTGRKIIVISVSEPGSEGKSYAVDEDGTIWWVDKIASGAYGGHETPTGIFHVLLKRRYHMSGTHPSKSGINNMDFEMLFTQQGIALHLGNPRALSHGCIHVGRKDVEAMFRWVGVGTKVVVIRGHYGQFLEEELKQFEQDIKNYDQ